MMTALILADAPVEALALTVSALVPGVVEGTIADAVVITAQPREDLASVAEAVGAKIAVLAPGMSPWAQGAKLARREWLLCLEAGDLPVEGWMGVLERFVSRGPAGARFGRLRRAAGLSERAAKAFERLAGTHRIRPGDLFHRDLVGESGFRRRQRPFRIAARIERAAI